LVIFDLLWNLAATIPPNCYGTTYDNDHNDNDDDDCDDCPVGSVIGIIIGRIFVYGAVIQAFLVFTEFFTHFDVLFFDIVFILEDRSAYRFERIAELVGIVCIASAALATWFPAPSFERFVPILTGIENACGRRAI
jgi:hypothetical protein